MLNERAKRAEAAVKTGSIITRQNAYCSVTLLEIKARLLQDKVKSLQLMLSELKSKYAVVQLSPQESKYKKKLLTLLEKIPSKNVKNNLTPM